MKISKKGLIYSPPQDGSWKDNSALTPTPFLKDENTIRVYASFRDPQGLGRIGYVDVEAQNPSRIIKISESPVLDIGDDGMFDDNGVILGDVIRHNGQVMMYYVGFQIAEKVKFLAFTGLAISNDNGNTFERVGKAPVLDRNDSALFINAIHSVHCIDGKFIAWTGSGSGWEEINNKKFPRYHIDSYQSLDGVSFTKIDDHCAILPQGSEYRLGRPRVFIHRNEFYVLFTYGTREGDYRVGMATSVDGKNWTRAPAPVLELGPEPWDSITACYAAPISANDKTYIFYNGNQMGVDGVGYAEIDF
jgi:hypothetical protein